MHRSGTLPGRSRIYPCSIIHAVRPMSTDSDSGAPPPRRQPSEPRRRPPAAPEAGRDPQPLPQLASLERLRDRIEAAARELQRLREENAALARRIHELEARPSASEELFRSFDEPPESLRRKIEGFIQTVDHYLEQEGNEL